VFELLSVAGLVGFSIGFVLLLTRYLKTAPAGQAAGLLPGTSPSAGAAGPPQQSAQDAAQTLQTLAALRGQGVIANEEFEARKAALLDQMMPAAPVSPSLTPQPATPETASCAHCGRPLVVGVRFCAGCGKPVAGVSSPGR
jgi:hypothetical protein